jgi:hypothetical protein
MIVALPSAILIGQPVPDDAVVSASTLRRCVARQSG